MDLSLHQIQKFSITALRAQYAGTVPVVIEATALKETVRYGYRCSYPDEYGATLVRAMLDIEKISLEDRDKMRIFIQENFTWGQSRPKK